MRGRVAHVDVVVLGRAVVEAALVALQFRLQCAAHDHVQFLKAAADAEERDAALDGAGDEAQRELVARVVVGLMVGRGLLAVVRRMHIGNSARHQDAVEPVEQGIEMQRIHDRRDHHRRAVRHFGYRADILVADRVIEESVAFVGIGGQADEGQV